MNYSYAPVNTIGTIGIPFESEPSILGHITQLSITIWLSNASTITTLDHKKITHLEVRVFVSWLDIWIDIDRVMFAQF